jgi:hypothetical protein
VFSRAAAVLILATSLARAGEPIAGKWLLMHQEVAGKETGSNPLTLAIAPAGKSFDFAFIVTVNEKPVVSLKFTSPLDGTEAEVTGGDGKKMGTAKVEKDARDGGSYKVLMEGPGRPAVTTHMTVSPDGKTLTSESDVTTPSGVTVHTEQIFSLQ